MAKGPDSNGANIHAMTVEIKTIAVSGKRMTSNMFCQLPRSSITDHFNELCGEPLGWVNVHPDQCSEDPPHAHVIWEDEGQLVRAWVWAPCRPWHRFHVPWGSAWISSATMDGWGPDRYRDEDGDHFMDISGVPCAIPYEQAHVQMWKFISAQRQGDLERLERLWHPSLIWGRLQEIVGNLDEIEGLITTEALFKTVESAAAEERARREAALRTWEKIGSCGQLYIGM
jgi:hypothetical protein